MPVRFFNRFKLAPGLTLNLSKRGASVSVGPPGAKYTVGTAGTRKTIGIPGSGLYYTEHNGGGRSHPAKHATPVQSDARADDPLDLGFFQRLLTPSGEQHFVDGMRQVIEGNDEAALAELGQAPDKPDAAFMAGMLALKLGQADHAIRHLQQAQGCSQGLGRLFSEYGVSAAVDMALTDHLTAVIEPAERGIHLALAEAYQIVGDSGAALDALEQVHAAAPDDPVALLSIVEILVDDLGSQDAYQRVVALTADADNTDPIRAGVCYWKGRALHGLSLLTAARDALSLAFRRKKNRSEEFLLAVQYARARVYEDRGDASRAREEFERIYADKPGYEDVAGRLGLA